MSCPLIVGMDETAPSGLGTSHAPLRDITNYGGFAWKWKGSTCWWSHNLELINIYSSLIDRYSSLCIAWTANFWVRYNLVVKTHNAHTLICVAGAHSNVSNVTGLNDIMKSLHLVRKWKRAFQSFYWANTCSLGNGSVVIETVTWLQTASQSEYLTIEQGQTLEYIDIVKL